MAEPDHSDKHSHLAFMGTLARGLAHEIKNPLSAMSINLQMLREDLEESEQQRDRRNLKRVGILEREVARLTEIVDNFQNFARGIVLKLARRRVNDLLREIVEFWAVRANEDGIEVQLVLDSDLPAVSVDETYFKQALLNLLINAQQAIAEQPDRDEGGDQIVVGSRPTRGGVEVLVIDSGPGIAAEVLEKVFDPYFSTKATGTGLGLATTRRIIEEHGGRLSVESEVGRGTSFQILLPLADPPAVGPGSTPEGEPADQGAPDG